MIDNFPDLSEYLDFSDPDKFYVIYIFKRRKENPEMQQDVKTIKVYYINSRDNYYLLKENIIKRCEQNNARSYINLNRRSYRGVAFKTLKLVADKIYREAYKKVEGSYNEAVGQTSSEPRKRWIIDIDENIIDYKEQIKKIISDIHAGMPRDKGFSILGEIQTLNGVHIITEPFDKQKFNILLKDIIGDITNIKARDIIRDDHPTLLYFR